MDSKDMDNDQKYKTSSDDLVENVSKDALKSTTENKNIKFNEQKTLIHDTSSSDQTYISHYISLADTKAAFILGICTGFLYILFNKYHGFLLKNLKLWNGLDLISSLSMLALLISIIFSVFVVYPRLITNKKKGLVSWVDISNYESANEYLSDLFKLGNEDLIKEHYSVNYFLSIVCRKKYDWLSRSFILAIIGALLGLLTIINI